MAHGRKAIDFSAYNNLLMFPIVTQMKKTILPLFLALVVNLEHILQGTLENIFTFILYVSLLLIPITSESWTKLHTILMRWHQTKLLPI